MPLNDRAPLGRQVWLKGRARIVGVWECVRAGSLGTEMIGPSGSLIDSGVRLPVGLRSTA